MPPPFLHINPAVLLEAAGNDIPVFLSLSATFLEIAPPMLARLQHAIMAGNMATIALESHSLKSTVALVGATHASALLAQVEAVSRGNGNSDAIIPLWPEVSSAYAAVEQEVRDSITHFNQPAGN